eukprot:PhF_6_TR18177/c0_g1_i2/m.26968
MMICPPFFVLLFVTTGAYAASFFAPQCGSRHNGTCGDGSPCSSDTCFRRPYGVLLMGIAPFQTLYLTDTDTGRIRSITLWNIFIQTTWVGKPGLRDLAS